MSDKLYLIKWENESDPSKSGGGKTPVTESIGKEWVADMNKEYKDLVHYLEPFTPKSV